jgi:hypothetical protein
VFKGEPCSYDSKFNIELTPELFESIKKQATDLKQKLIEKHGKKSKFYTEFGIISKELSQEIKDMISPAYDSINGKIDLLVIDDFGKAHIYDFKVSRKDVGAWDEKTNTITRVNKQ